MKTPSAVEWVVELLIKMAVGLIVQGIIKRLPKLSDWLRRQWRRLRSAHQ